jgi:tetratricopeptide (TPR) repeat protein
MQATEDTQPRRGDVFPEEEYEDTSPGCAVWGFVGAFGILLSLAIVLAAAEAGVRQGANIGERTAVARTQEFVARECEVLPTDIALERVSIVRTRYDNWAQRGAIPLCAQAYIPEATQIYVNSLATDTPMPTATLEATATSQPTDMPTAMVESTVDSANVAPTSLYDLAGLLQEARDFITAQNYTDAIRTLDAIIAIDPNYETATVNQLLFNSLTTHATNLYRSSGSLAEAIQLTNRAELYGDIQDLNYERSVAQYYLDAQGFLDVNYPAAIQQLNQVQSFATNYRNTNQLLAQQYEGYGDALVIGGEPCRAVQQYDALLALQQQPSIQVKRDNAQNQCNGIGIVPTFDPNATVDPNAPTAAPTNAIAPVGQQGG